MLERLKKCFNPLYVEPKPDYHIFTVGRIKEPEIMTQYKLETDAMNTITVLMEKGTTPAKVAAIKLLRGCTGAGLKHAKYTVEAWTSEGVPPFIWIDD